MEKDIHILVVDDVPQNLVAIAALLKRPGIEVLQARSGTEALETLLVHEVAVALVDVQMPQMDGFELAELIRGSGHRGRRRLRRVLHPGPPARGPDRREPGRAVLVRPAHHHAQQPIAIGVRRRLEHHVDARPREGDGRLLREG